MVDTKPSKLEKWNQRYLTSFQPNRPAQVLVENQHLLPAGGTALDLACGLGGNALLLAQLGLQTHAWDLSDVAISKLERFAQTQQLAIHCRCAELKPALLAERSFDVIVVSGFLDRNLCHYIAKALKIKGILLYQTHTAAKALAFGPSNPEFLLQPGELLQLFSSLAPIVYREEGDCGDLLQGLRNQAYLIARRGQ